MAMPRMTTMKSTETKGTSARADIVRASTVMPPLNSVCQDLKDRRRFRRVTGRWPGSGIGTVTGPDELIFGALPGPRMLDAA